MDMKKYGYMMWINHPRNKESEKNCTIVDFDKKRKCFEVYLPLLAV